MLHLPVWGLAMSRYFVWPSDSTT